jgi:hypothetical protein
VFCKQVDGLHCEARLHFFIDSKESPTTMSTNTKNRTQTREVKKRPVHEIRMGRIRAAIWPNQTESGVRHNVTISRLYKDGDEWKDTTSFGRDDLPLVAKVCDLAHTWIYNQSSGNTNGNGHSDSGDDGHS